MKEHAEDHAGPETTGVARAAGSQSARHVRELLALQRTAGNRAVGRILARDTPTSLKMRPEGDPGWTFNPLKPATSIGLAPISPIPPLEARAAIEAWLGANRDRIAAAKKAGGFYMEDLVALIRREVPKAENAIDFQIEFTIDQYLAAAAPAYRPKPKPVNIPGLGDKLGKLIPDLEKVIVEKDGSYLKIGISGLEGRVKAKGPKTDQTTVKVGPGGVELTNEDSQTTATLTLGWGDSFGIKTKVPGGTVFEAAIGKEGDAWGKWTVSLSIPIVGKEVVEARPPVSEIIESVNKGYGAATAAIGLLRGGAKPTDEAVKEKFKDVKPAVEKLGKAVEERKGPNVTFKFGAEGSPTKTPTGETRQSTFVGVSLVVEF